MLKCETAQELIADRLYDALAAADEVALTAHLTHCQDCAGVQQELQAALNMVRRAEQQLSGTSLPHQTTAEMAGLWSSLQPELDRIDARRYQELARVHQRHRWYMGGAIAASLFVVVAVLTQLRPIPVVPDAALLSQTETATTETATTEPTDAGTASATTAVIGRADYESFLNRAQVALLSVANTESGNSINLPFAREQAGFLAQEASLLNLGLNDSLSVGQMQLLNDIEYLLLQYANLEDGDLASGLEVLQLFLNNNTLLFKLNLAEMRDANPVI